jgi:hypothetical protein
MRTKTKAFCAELCGIYPSLQKVRETVTPSTPQRLIAVFANESFISLKSIPTDRTNFGSRRKARTLTRRMNGGMAFYLWELSAANLVM